MVVRFARLGSMKLWVDARRKLARVVRGGWLGRADGVLK